jgi:hypothetical protein
MARSKRAKQWAGVLAEPIDDIETLMPKPYPMGSPESEKWLRRRAHRLYQLRIAKMPELARQLGMPVDTYDRTTKDGLMRFYTHLALKLAVKLEIPGFMQANRKWPPELVYWALVDGDARRTRGERDPDFTSCLDLIQHWDPRLRQRGKKAAANQRAKTLRNEVSKLRQRVKKRAAKPAAIEEFIRRRGAQPSNVIEFHKKKPVIS